jgi:hypothetical protein
VFQFASLAGFPAAGESGKIYIAADTGHTYRWNGTKYVGIHESVLNAEKNVFSGKVEWNNSEPTRAADSFEGDERDARGLFVNSFDSSVWIAPAPRLDPTVQSQGLYVQHRVTGNLGGKVHDAAASELRVSNATNNGSSSCAHENSVVVTGGVNQIGRLIGTLSNFHCSGTPTGTLDTLQIIRAQQAFDVPAGFTIGEVYGVYIDSQVAGTKNFSLFVDGGDSVLFGRIVPKDSTAKAIDIRSRSDTVANTPLLSVGNSTGSTLFQATSSGTAGVGGTLNSTFWVNNNLSTPGVVALRVRAHPSQTNNIVEVLDGAGAQLFYIAPTGELRINGEVRVKTSVRSVDANLDLNGNGGVVRAGGTQVEVKGHTHVAADVVGAESTAKKGVANGYAPLDATSKVPAANLPARWVAVPASATAPGTAGDTAYASGFLYVCVAANTWQRTALTTW